MSERHIVKVRDMAFPMTPETFCAAQETLIGSPVDDSWREIFALSVVIINDEYARGLNGEPLLGTDGVLASPTYTAARPSAVVQEFAKALQKWCASAHARGVQSRAMPRDLAFEEHA